MKTPDEDVLTLEEVAAVFRMTVRTLRRQIAAGYFPAPHSVGHTQVYTREDVAAAALLYGRWGPQAEPIEPPDDELPTTKSGHKKPNSTI